MKRKTIIHTLVVSSAFAFLLISGLSAFRILNSDVKEAKGYSTSSLPTTIDLNDTSSANIRSYYSSLNSLPTSERQGTNLLKNLKTILKNNQKYYSYDSGSAIWQIYEISDRDWDLSPASGTTYGTYNSSTNTITGYTYGSSYSSAKNNPYLHALYVNRDVTNKMRAWVLDGGSQNCHGDNAEWYIDREHIWPKSQGFNESGKGGARGDPMHLWAGDSYVNSALHNNNLYGYVNTSSSYTDGANKWSYTKYNYLGQSLTLGTSVASDNVFEPQDSDKGDIARAIFYMVARYNYYSGSDSDGIDTNNPNLILSQTNDSLDSYTSSTSSTGKMGILTDLLAWNRLDPPDEWEIHRNNLLYTNYTNNRNPFIDYPEWAEYIWGTATYSGRNYQSYSSTPSGYATPSSDTLNDFSDSGSSSSTSLSIDKTSTTIAVNGTTTITATALNGSGSITWSTSDSSVASISASSGSSITVTGVAEGSATITCSYSGETATCAITVSNSGSSSESVDVTISTDDYTAGYTATTGTSGTISKTVSSSGDVSISYSGINTQSANGNSYTYTMYMAGYGYIYSTSCPSGYYPSTVTVTFSSTTGTSGKAGITFGSSIISSLQTVTGSVTTSGTCTATNTNQSNLYWNFSTNTKNVQVSSIVVTYSPVSSSDTVSLNKSSTTLLIGGTETLTATSSGNVTWSTSDSSVATVSSSGLVTAIAAGTATITATCGTATATCIVTVSSVTVTSVTVSPSTLSLDLNGTTTGTLAATVTGTNNPAQTVTWTSSNTSCATVSSSGVVTAVAIGSATITATSTVDTSKSGTCTVAVTNSGSSSGGTEAGTFTISLTDQSLAESTSYITTETSVSSYNGGDATANLAFNNINPKTGQLKGNQNTSSNLQSGSNFYIHNTSALPGSITSITISGISVSGTSAAYTAAKAYASTGSAAITSQTTSATAGTDGSSSVTWTFDESSSGKYFAIGCEKEFTSGTVKATSFIIEYAASESSSTDPIVTGVSVSPSYMELTAGGTTGTLTETVSVENNAATTVTWSSSNTSVATVSSSGVVTPVGAGTATITATSTYDSTKSGSATVKVNAASLTAGSPYMNGVPYKVYFNNGTSNYYFTGSMSGYYGATSTAIASGQDMFFEASGSGQNLYFIDSSGNKYYCYIVVSGSYVNFKCDATTAPSTAWEYDSTNGCLTYTIDSTSYTLGENGTTYTTLAAYSVSDTTYKIDFIANDDNGAAGFAYCMLNSITCDSTGSTTPSFSGSLSWSDLSAAFAKLSSTNQATFTNASADESGTTIEQAVARYDYIVGKYGVNTYSNFMNRNVSTSTANKINITIESNYVLTLAIIISSLSLVTTAAYFFLKKRKED